MMLLKCESPETNVDDINRGHNVDKEVFRDLCQMCFYHFQKVTVQRRTKTNSCLATTHQPDQLFPVV